MKDKKFEYFEIREISQLPAIELLNAEEFIRLAEEFKSRIIFFSKPADDSPNGYFLFLYDKFIYRIRRNGYLMLTDYADAEENGFPSAEVFYKARQGNFVTFKEFRECEEKGITDHALYLKAKRLGYVDNFTAMLDRVKEKPQYLPQDYSPDLFSNPVVLCEFASDRGFKDYGDFQKAFFLGFSDKFLYDEAQKKGFQYAADFIKATQMGFDNVKEYSEALFLKINSKAEYLRFLQLKSLSMNKYSCDEAELIEKLKLLECGKKLSLNKISTLLEEIVAANKINGSRRLPEWYSQKLTSRKALRAFLIHNEVIKTYGFFDADGEYYQSSQVSTTQIYLDGSNIAFGETNRKSAKPEYNHILQMIRKLKELRFSVIIVIADASLKHRVDDLDLLSEIKKEAEYHEVPSNTTADEFLFSRIKGNKCYLVSNDTFKDWKMKDPWVAQNIDQLRVPFLFTNGNISLPALEREKEVASK